MKFIDKTYFYFKNVFSRYDEGYDNGYDVGHVDGYKLGKNKVQSEILRRLETKNPEFTDQSFQLGYLHAIAIVKGDI